MRNGPRVVLGVVVFAAFLGCGKFGHDHEHDSHYEYDARDDCGPGGGANGGGDWGGAASVWFYSNNYVGGGAAKSVYWRAEVPGGVKVIPIPAHVGDNAAYEAAHFSSTTSGAAVVRDTDGASAHVLRYDPASRAWVDVLRVTCPEVIQTMIHRDADSPNAAVVMVHSWPDGSLVAAVAMTDRRTWTHTLWSVVAVPGRSPVERLVPFGATDPYLACGERMSVFLTGAKTPYELRAVGVSATGAQTQRTVALALNTEGAVSSTPFKGVTGRFYSPGFTGVDDFWLGDPDADGYVKPNRYCRAVSCEAPTFGAPSPAPSLPFSFVGASETPNPWIKIADMRQTPPAIHAIPLPTPSTEMRVDVFYPDPEQQGSLRLVAYDADISFQRIEYVRGLASGNISTAPNPGQLDLRGYFADPEVLKFWHYDPPLPIYVFYRR